MSKEKLDIAVMIGRFQPAHKAHIQIINRALEIANRLVIIIGSHNKPRTVKNPFTSEEREGLIRSALSKDTNKLVDFSYVEDTIYNTQDWVRSIQEAVNKKAVGFPWKEDSMYSDYSVILVGHHKDDTSYYLDMFPQWGYLEISNIDDVNSTDIRNNYFGSDKDFDDRLPQSIANFLNDFELTENFKNLTQEYNYNQRYRKEWENSPYPPIFVTTDAVIVQSGHILLVTRGQAPGKGLLALPGGFINQYERLEDCMVRELREETKLKVPLPVLKGNIKKIEVFDSPYRSSRGRTITHAFLIELPAGQLPKVKGGSDANKAQWIPLNEIYHMKDKMFEDHQDIIFNMLGNR